MNIKIAHCADIHLNCNSDEEYELFIDMLKICKENNVSFLLIAGDLFDDVNIPESKYKWVKEALKYFGIKTIISPGNHDPFTPDSPYSDSSWPENVFIFKTNQMSCFFFPDFNLKIWGSAFTGIYQKKSLFSFKDNVDERFINICVMHGMLTDSNNGIYYNPILNNSIETSSMDYVALGHIHKRSKILNIGKTFYSYCGCLSGKSFKETGDKGIYIGEVSRNYCDMNFYKVSKKSYEKISVDISGCTNNNDAAECALKKIKSFKENFDKNYYHISFIGCLDEDFVLDTEYIDSILNKQLLFVKSEDSTEVKIDTQKLKLRKDFKSIFIKKAIVMIEKSQNEEEKAINEMALKLGLKAFTEDVGYNDK